jgi:hypothetical protein
MSESRRWPSAGAPLKVPKVLSSRFHATTRGSGSCGAGAPEPPAKRQRRANGPGDAADDIAECSRRALSVYRTFPTQQAAFDFWDAQPAHHAHLLRTFAVEWDASGRRSFIVAAPERFWAEYRALPHAQRNHYEVRLAAQQRLPHIGPLPSPRGRRRG